MKKIISFLMTSVFCLSGYSQTIVADAFAATAPGSVNVENIKEYKGCRIHENPLMDYAKDSDGYILFDVKTSKADDYIFRAYIATGNEGSRLCRLGPIDSEKNYVEEVVEKEIKAGTSSGNWSGGTREYEWTYSLKSDTVYTFRVSYDKKNYSYGINIYEIDIISASYTAPKIPAFPGAEGAGRYTTGGRGGKIYKVTNLNDKGPGSLREAVEAYGKRIVIFEVAGLISLESPLSISNNDITILGQTAPGKGICIKNYSINVAASNVIIRYLRSRMGDEANYENDAIYGRYQKDIIIDHCSFSWCVDECASFYTNENFTMQWSTICESLNASVHQKENHGYGGLWGGTPASFHHNLMIHHSSRTPRLTGGEPETELVDLTNNVIYNWGPGYGSYGGTGGNYNFINNYYKPGPSTAQKSHLVNRILYTGPRDEPEDDGTYVWGNFYFSGNHFDTTCKYITTSQRKEAESTNTDNYLGLHLSTTENLPGGVKEGIISPKVFKVAPVTIHTAHVAYDKVLKYAGASLVKDTQDIRYAEETLSGKFTYKGSNGSQLGIIDSQNDAGGWDIYSCTQAQLDRIKDSDGDGIPDIWEENKGLNPVDADDREHSLSEDYMNIEVYANSLVEHITRQCVSLDESTGIIDNISDSDESPVYIYPDSLNSPGARKIEIFTPSGVLIASQKGESINTAYLSSGIYIVKIVSSDNRNTTKKIEFK